jgi:hypothetical protein
MYLSRMADSFASLVDSIPVIDVHEHHMPDTTLRREVGLIQILEESYAGWTRARTYSLPDEPPVTLGASGTGPGSWKEIAGFVQGSGTNAFVQNVVRALAELYDLEGGEITEGNWRRLDEKIRERHADPGWYGKVMDRAGIEKAVSDPYKDPLMDVTKALGERYRSVMRINSFAVGWHPESRDHNGNSAQEMLGRLGIHTKSFDEYLQSFERVLDMMPGRHMVALKNALAYDRSVNFDNVDEDLARTAWGKRAPSALERKAFGDVVIDRLCRLAGERGIPSQMHLGTALIRTSRPLEAAGLIERNPKTRFLLMHLAYPWTDELLGMAFVYRNIWIDLTWSWLISPSRFIGSLRQAIDVLPDESRMMLGGDTWHVEEAYGAITLARRLIGEALEQSVKAGQFRASDAERLARKILYDNAASFFRL